MTYSFVHMNNLGIYTVFYRPYMGFQHKNFFGPTFKNLINIHTCILT